MKNKLLVLMLALLLVMPLVSSTKVALVGSADDLSIIIPRFDYFEINQNYTLNVHASNLSRVLTNKTTSCYANLYNNNGQHLFKNQIPFSSSYNEWEVYINPNNFSKLGELNLMVWCNSSTQVGLIDIVSKVTPTGEPITPTNSLYNFLLFIIVLIGIIISMINTLIKLKDNNTGLKDVVFSLCIYTAFISFYYYITQYVYDTTMIGILDAFLYPAGVCLLFLPFVGAFLSWVQKRRIE